MKKFKLLIVVFIFILVVSSSVAFAKFKDIIYGAATATLKTPNFLVENSQEINGQISSLTNNYYESEFNILNYIRRIYK